MKITIKLLVFAVLGLSLMACGDDEGYVEYGGAPSIKSIDGVPYESLLNCKIKSSKNETLFYNLSAPSEDLSNRVYERVLLNFAQTTVQNHHAETRDHIFGANVDVEIEVINDVEILSVFSTPSLIDTLAEMDYINTFSYTYKRPEEPLLLMSFERQENGQWQNISPQVLPGFNKNSVSCK